METQDYTVKITNSQDSVRLTQTGSQLYHVVTFYVGARGPYTLTYTERDSSAARIQADIAARVSMLRQLDNGSY